MPSRTEILKRWLPELLFAGLFLFSYLPHFLYTWMPLIMNDTYAYMLVAKDICEGNLPLSGYTIDLPPGYPLAVVGVMQLGGGLKHVILLQTAVNLLAFLILIGAVKEISRRSALLFAPLAWLYVSNADSMLWNTLIYTESFYISSLVVMTAMLLRHLQTGRSAYLYGMMAMVLCAALMRSNGIYLFFLPALLFLRSLVMGDGQWRHVLIGVLGTVALSSATNLMVKGTALPFESDRIQRMVSKTRPAKEVPTQQWTDPYRNTFGSAARKLLTNAANTQMGNHYYYRVHTRILSFHQDSLIAGIMHHGHIYPQYRTVPDPKPEMLVGFMLGGSDPGDAELQAMHRITDIELRPRHPWLYMNHLVHLARPLGRNMFFVAAFFGLLLWSAAGLCRGRGFIGSMHEKVLLVSLVHFLSLLLLMALVPRDTSISRYAIVSEFTIYLTLSLALFSPEAEALKNRIAQRLRFNRI